MKRLKPRVTFGVFLVLVFAVSVVAAISVWWRANRELDLFDNLAQLKAGMTYDEVDDIFHGHLLSDDRPLSRTRTFPVDTWWRQTSTSRMFSTNWATRQLRLYQHGSRGYADILFDEHDVLVGYRFTDTYASIHDSRDWYDEEKGTNELGVITNHP